jgi:hypothetical protein
MNGQTPLRFHPQLFGADKEDSDLYALGFQEACPPGDLERLLTEQLPESQYSKVCVGEGGRGGEGRDREGEGGKERVVGRGRGLVLKE